MGVNNRQRRADKRRKRERSRAHRPHGGHTDDTEVLVGRLIAAAVDAVAEDRSKAASYAEAITDPASPVPVDVSADVLFGLLRDLGSGTCRAGWLPTDLSEVLRRRLPARNHSSYLALLIPLLTAEAERHAPDKVAAAWRSDLAELGDGGRLNVATPMWFERTLELASVLIELPVIQTLVPPPGAGTTIPTSPDSPEHRILTKVRALLAKAEATGFDAEAEALSAKAQELISRHALDQLAHRADHLDGEPVVARRLWIDAPYVVAKAMLIDAVAGANRCRCVLFEELGFATLLGEAADLDAVELLVASLLVQSDAAMLRCARQSDHARGSRSSSFRRSFLIAYASRIGERLTHVSEEAVTNNGSRGVLLPVLRRQAERVDAAFEEMFPSLRSREASINNPLGWAAGRAAADLALLNVQPEVTEEAV